MKRNDNLSRKARYGILAAIMAGAFSIMPAAQALPTGGASGTATITQSGSQMDIASSVASNLLTWQDFSIAKDETVNFAGANSYLNVVLGANRSEIYGAITGSEANVYLVNPNGILVGDGATINVGSLHLSTADISGSVTDFTTAQIALNSAVDFKGDVVNKGILTAAQDITVDGDNVTFKNVANVTAPNSFAVKAKNTDAFHVGRTDDTALALASGSTDPTYYKLVSTAEELQNIKNNLSGNYMLANDITLTAPANTASGSNFTPIGSTGVSHWNVDAEKFTGRFDGLNYTIDNLYINVNTNEGSVSAGLFATIGASGVVENLKLGTGKSTLTLTGNGYNGSVAGINYGTLRNVVNDNVEVTGSNYSSGGITGYNLGLIDGAKNNATVTAIASYASGGIVGTNDKTLKNATNTGNVTNTTENINEGVGGIAGSNRSDLVENVSNSGTITGKTRVGGIVGLNQKDIKNAVNTGVVSGQQYVGGIAGKNTQNISNTYNTGDITSTGKAIGGITGQNEGIIQNAYNTGNVTGSAYYVGGIAGENGAAIDGMAIIRNVYNTGDVVGGSSSVGGIVGCMGEISANQGINHTYGGEITNAYNTGNIKTTGGRDYIAGIVGAPLRGKIANVYSSGTVSSDQTSEIPYWEDKVIGRRNNDSHADYENAKAISDASAMKQAATFAGFAIDKDGTDTTAPWRIYEGKTMPLLTAFLTPLILENTTVTYDGQAHTLGNVAKLDTTKILGGELPSYTEVGTHSYSGITSLYSDQQGYNIKAASDTATLTISPIALELTASGYSKTYDGTTTATGGTVVATKGNILGGVGSLAAAYSDKNAGTDKAMIVTGLGKNYQVTTTSTGNTITKKALSMTAESFTKVYDGTNDATGEASIVGVVEGDDFGAKVVGTFDNGAVDAGKNQPVTYTAIDIHGTDAGNYDLTKSYQSTGTITPKPLTVTFANISKTYDGTTAGTAGAGTLAGVLDADKNAVSVNADAAYDAKNAGSRTVSYTEVSLTGTKADNYSIDKTATGAGIITAAPLTLTVVDTSKQYDGTTEVTDGQYAMRGTLYGTDSLSGGTYAYADKNAGTGKTVSLTGVTVNDGNEGRNYDLTIVNSTNSTITAAPLSLAVVDTSKQYDGTTEVTDGQYAMRGTLYGTDSLSGGTYDYADKNAGTGKTVSLTGVTVNDGNEGKNYDLTIVNSTNSTITAAPLTLTVKDYTKEYDGTVTAPGAEYSLTFGQLLGEDALSGGIFAFDNKEVGTGKTLTLSDVTVNDGNAGQNYTLTYVPSTNSSITANAPSVVVDVMEDTLKDMGSSIEKVEEVVAVAAPAPAAVVPSVETVAPAAPEPAPAPASVAEPQAASSEPAATQEDNKQEESVETASTTATTHGDSDKQEETAQSVGEKQVVHNVLDGDGILTVENDGVNPPDSMNAEKVATQESE
ncbi:filamentous hemagglutinin family N-terminal domain-containing protein [Selenomonas ruminantium]|uniref:Filamentous hemagglutinin family N-terminal domain-containing protein n=1 Tax=Selenomonas ruminantium TaxID=971 RepID=A0A1M6UEW5_SELRU|nr:YDG domain-containing protein [Selenomonas ruminantium]SHK67701.1 filamentous hemagglutinin family N-terminal domain-containing protein [Selenomonas ruminantium]